MGTFKFFNLHLRVPFLILALIEFFICIVAVYVAFYVRFDGRDIAEVQSVNSPIISSVLFGLVMPVTMLAMGLYQSRFRGGVLGVFLRSVLGFACGAALLAFVFYIFPSLYLGRGVFGLALIIAFFMVGTIRPLFFYYVDKDLLKVRVLVLGAGENASLIRQRMRRKVDRRGFRIVGYKPLDSDTGLKVDPSLVVQIPDQNLFDYCSENEVDEIVIAADEKRGGLPLNDLLNCKLYGLTIIELLSFFEREQGKLPMDILRPDWLIYSDGFDRGALRYASKRCFDVVASLLILLVTWPLMLLAIIAIKIEDGLSAPIYYGQVRVGYLGKRFEVLKFRSMAVNAEHDGVAQWATKRDLRVTRVGEIIRRTRIDELPQILNVLRGDMSFVGPRPERPQFVDQLAETIPYYQERHAVKPGITGWAQVCYPYGASVKDSMQKQEFDLYYIKNHTIFLDMLILCQTAEVVLFGKGSR